MQEVTKKTLDFPSTEAKDVLTEILREGAQSLLVEAVEAEVAEWIETHAHLKDADGRRQVVRNGRLPRRKITTGVGQVEIEQPRVHDRRGNEAERFSSKILPPYLRKTKSIEELIPWLYLKGISTGDFGEALQSILGRDVPGLSASTITRLKRHLGERLPRLVQALAHRESSTFTCGPTACISTSVWKKTASAYWCSWERLKDGKKELIAIADGYRESAQSWKELLLGREITRTGCRSQAGHRRRSAWASGRHLREVWPAAREQRCWVHKTANVLDKLPKRLQPAAKENGCTRYGWPTHASTPTRRLTCSWRTYQAKYPKACECLAKDRDVLLTFYDFPAEHWIHLRTTNPIESTFATVRHRHRKTKGSGTRLACLTMVFKLMESAAKRWRLLNGHQIIPCVIEGIKFVDGIREDKVAA